jgi:hypothetical protein
MQDLSRNHGDQPLDTLMTCWAITNHDLVGLSGEQLNHKQVQKARKGRQLTLHMMMKITRTLNDAILARLPEANRPAFQPYLHRHLFSYAKAHDSTRADPNSALFPPVKPPADLK